VIDWLGRLGNTIVSKPWSIELASPPRARDEHGDPVFWTGDATVLALSSPHPGAETEISFRVGTNTHGDSVQTSDEGDAFVAIRSQEVGTTKLFVADSSAGLAVAFVTRPSREVLLEQLTATPRVRVWLGEMLIEAWRDSSKKVPLQDPLIEVRVDLGAADARASVTVWEGGKRRTRRGLDNRNAGRAIAEALHTASRIELDADNFGCVEFMPAPVSTKNARSATARDRMAWFDHVASLSAQKQQYIALTLFERPRASTSLSLRHVAGPALVRSRLCLRRRHDEVGGNR
jgi:hypothetical protein